MAFFKKKTVVAHQAGYPYTTLHYTTQNTAHACATQKGSLPLLAQHDWLTLAAGLSLSRADKQRAAAGKQRPNRRRFLHLLIRHIIHPVLGHRVSHGDVGVVRVHVRFEIRVHLSPLLECDAGKYTRHSLRFTQPRLHFKPTGIMVADATVARSTLQSWLPISVFIL